VLLDPLQGLCLVFGKTVRGIDNQDICTGLDQRWNTFCVVAGIDAGPDHQTLLLVQQLVGVFFVIIVVLTEYHADQAAICGEDRQLVDLVIPNNVIGLAE